MMAERRPRIQYAALPYTVADGRISILLVTSRDTGRWIVPKGWPERKTKPHVQAAREAFEEAGVTGKVTKEPFGTYLYEKRLRVGTVTCSVDVYLLKVEREVEDWPERHQRARRWVSPAEGLQMVEDVGLAELLLRLDASPTPGAIGRSGHRHGRS
jgi:8-oxo-dGTP pyrophosphatase MutT (NUDIX family)